MSSLRFKGVTARQLAGMMRNAEVDAKHAAFDVMKEETHVIMGISVRQAPVDDGELESAHRVVINRNQTDKAHYSIEVGGVVGGVDVDAYAERIHEGIGWEKLGPRSISKQGAVAPLVVGSHFLTRAFDARVETTIKRVAAALSNGVRRHVG